MDQSMEMFCVIITPDVNGKTEKCLSIFDTIYSPKGHLIYFRLYSKFIID